MNKGLEARIRAGLTPHLEAGEQLRSVAQFESGGALTDFPRVTVVPWWGGITDRGRLLLVKVTRLTAKPVEGEFFALPVGDVTFHKTGPFTADLLVLAGNGSPPGRLHFEAFESARKEFETLLVA